MFHCIRLLFDFNPAHPDQLLIFKGKAVKKKRDDETETKTNRF